MVIADLLVLCDGLIRIEYDKDKTFEDRATQVVLNRNFDSVKFQVKKDEEKIIIITDRITLTYYRGCEFAPNTLFAHFYGGAFGVSFLLAVWAVEAMEFERNNKNT